MVHEIFFWIDEEDSRMAWDLSTVCQLWCAIARGMPRLWSKLASPDIVRPWLERANLLNIEIYIVLSTTNVPLPTPNIWSPRTGAG
ncbi:uncharacterized protein SCHCODRAFT_01208795 [Schizophyllum commune H4-8]|uniref:uncharacterized protein n=1 Tax=Schizophyllum commune (strain H4-8 / FGSC 9210) TaxID=578458 RepID=UPI002160DE24|nr:uncharacterized protein SCHCODRAFT_01208795 [Schizophyllum commune H4-8]KAI5898332.1 hypothetical protein SCHCODRAFT_01208795 [Schizophyllum commune H4-8]